MSIDQPVLVRDWIRLIVDTCDLKQIQFRLVVPRTRHALLVHGEYAALLVNIFASLHRVATRPRIKIAKQ